MTASDVITLVRQEVNDTFEEQYRFKDAEMFSALTDAVRELAQDRPDLLLTAAGAYDTISDITALADVLKYGDNERQALMHYTCFRILSKDSEDDQNMKLASYHLNQYRTHT